MRNTSSAFRKLVAENTKTLFRATLVLKDGTTRQIDGDETVMGSARFDDSVSSSGSFDVGAAIINRFSMTLNNYDGRFDSYDFSDLEIVPYVGVQIGNSTEWALMGHYFIEQPDVYGSTISIVAYDNMRSFEKPYSEVNTVYPATLRTIVVDICNACGVNLFEPNFDNYSYVIQNRPNDASMSCLAMLAHVAQVSGHWARANEHGQLVFEWYDQTPYDNEGWKDGGTFDTDTTPYSDGDAANGGGFMYGGDDVSDSSFSPRGYAVLSSNSSVVVNTDDVVITGVRVSSEPPDESFAEDTTLEGAEGYVLGFAGNPLIEYGKSSQIAAMIGAHVIGMRFRAFNVSTMGDPSIQAGDAAILVDERQVIHRTYISTLNYSNGSYESVAMNAESPGRNRAASYSDATKAYVKAKDLVKREKSAREIAIQNLARQLEGSSGLYKTEEPQQDGSTIYYLHDKATLAQSQIIWKLTAEAFAISTDGGQTYPFGFNAWGQAILNSLYAIGIDADYINTGALAVRDGNTTVFNADIDTGAVLLQDASGNMWNLHTGELTMAAGAKIGGQTVAQIAGSAAASAVSGQTQEDIFKKLTGASSISDQSKGLWIRNGELYVNATLIQSGILQVLDASGNIVFKADMNTKAVQMAGFTAIANALYNGLSSLAGTSQGVYIGTDGMASNTSDKHMELSSGRLKASITSSDEQANGKGGYVDASAGVNPSSVWPSQKYGLRVHGDEIIALDSPDIVISQDGNTWRYGLDEFLTHYLVKSVSTSGTDSVTLGWEKIEDKHINGLRANVTTADRSGGPFVPDTGSATLPTKSYVDAELAKKAPLASPALTGTPTAPTASSGTSSTQIATTAFVANGLSGKLNTNDIASWAKQSTKPTYTASEVGALPNTTQVPTFNLSGTTLNITTSA